MTNFFRDPQSFETLKKILLELVKSKPDNGQIRIWVPGCYTGEEAYTIAILLRECLDETKKYLNVQIFATDIHSDAIEKARIGSFLGIGSDVNKKRLSRIVFNANPGVPFLSQVKMFAPVFPEDV